MFEKSDDIGGLWRYRDDDYGVMNFTHINVSKYNYCFSDHEFPKSAPDYPHHSEMYAYIKSYADRFKLFENMNFKHQIEQIEGIFLFKFIKNSLYLFFYLKSKRTSKR